MGLAWLLLVIFTMPIVAKEGHIYLHEYQSAHHAHADGTHHTEHDCSTCAICQFTMSSFTEADWVIPISGISLCFLLLATPYTKERYTFTTSANYLRAPPVTV